MCERVQLLCSIVGRVVRIYSLFIRLLVAFSEAITFVPTRLQQIFIAHFSEPGCSISSAGYRGGRCCRLER